MENGNNKLPTVLVIGQAFHRKNGGAVTLSNLFEGWNKNKLFSLPFGKDIVEFDVCPNVFLMGYQSRFPIIFWPFVKNKSIDRIYNPSNYLKINGNSNEILKNQKQVNKNNNSNFRNFLFFLNTFLGINHISHRYRLSANLKDWLNSINPDLIYAQYSDFASMNFVLYLRKYLGKPLIIHIMDDWISGLPITNTGNTLFKYGLFNVFWKKQYLKLFIKLLSESSQRIAISEEMAMEYFKRYGYKFSWTHNYVDPTNWREQKIFKNDIKNEFTIGYFGSINIKNLENFIDLIEAVKIIDINVKIKIFSNTTLIIKNKYNSSDYLQFYDHLGFEEYQQELFKCALLFLPLGFSSKSFSYGKLSIPTKLGEYMMSKVPILVYASEDTALYKFCLKHQCAQLVGKKNIKILCNAIEEVINDTSYVEKIVNNAYSTAVNLLDKRSMLAKFREIIMNTYTNHFGTPSNSEH